MNKNELERRIESLLPQEMFDDISFQTSFQSQEKDLREKNDFYVNWGRSVIRAAYGVYFYRIMQNTYSLHRLSDHLKTCIDYIEKEVYTKYHLDDFVTTVSSIPDNSVFSFTSKVILLLYARHGFTTVCRFLLPFFQNYSLSLGLDYALLIKDYAKHKNSFHVYNTKTKRKFDRNIKYVCNLRVGEEQVEGEGKNIIDARLLAEKTFVSIYIYQHLQKKRDRNLTEQRKNDIGKAVEQISIEGSYITFEQMDESLTDQTYNISFNNTYLSEIGFHLLVMLSHEYCYNHPNLPAGLKNKLLKEHIIAYGLSDDYLQYLLWKISYPVNSEKNRMKSSAFQSILACLFVNSYNRTNRRIEKYSKEFAFKAIQSAISVLQKQIAQHQAELSEALQLLNNTYSQIEALINNNHYFSNTEIKQIRNKYSLSIQKINSKRNILYRHDYNIQEKLEELLNLENILKKANQDFIEREKKDKSTFFSQFDDSQSEAIISDDDQLLVIAGAGSGKTRTIEGKVNYLTEYKKIDPSSILLVSYTKATVKDLNDRNLKVKAYTFHQIGKDIIGKSQQKSPSSFDNDKKTNFIKTFLTEKIDDPQQIQMFLDYFLYDVIPPESDNIDDYYAMVEDDVNKNGFLSYRSIAYSSDRTGLTGQRFKSKEEAIIANYFFLHGIRFEYEGKYKYQVYDGLHNAYKPDFYLPEYDLYLEHFGITRDRKVPFTRKYDNWKEEEKKYINGMEWKRRIHQQKNTKLLETYSFDFTENTIVQKLHDMLEKNGVKIHEPDISELKKLFTKIIELQNPLLNSFVDLLASFITQYKSSGKSLLPGGFSNLYHLNESNPPYRRERIAKFLSIAETVYNKYQDTLAKNGEIDFEDMINNACAVLRSNKCNPFVDQKYGTYKYVIVDEFQDISAQRMELIQLICKKSGAKLFCVGDDWQSIYRFSGSDLSNIISFRKTYPNSKILPLSYTYRYSQQLSNISSNFIQKNPRQIEKKIISKKYHSKPVVIVETYGDQFPYILEILNEIAKTKANASVYILGRYKNDENSIKFSSLWKKYGSIDLSLIYDDNQRNFSSIVRRRWPELDVKFYTIHSSKGLEADYVIVLNCNDDKRGFPSKIESDPVMNLVLPLKDKFPYEEERRLFYVALTRARNKVFLLANAESPSDFVLEIKDYPDVELRSDLTQKIPMPPKCPWCRKFLITKIINNKTYWSCSSYPECKYKREYL